MRPTSSPWRTSNLVALAAIGVGSLAQVLQPDGLALLLLVAGRVALALWLTGV